MKCLSKYTKNRIVKLWLSGTNVEIISGITGVELDKVTKFIEREMTQWKPDKGNLNKK